MPKQILTLLVVTLVALTVSAKNVQPENPERAIGVGYKPTVPCPDDGSPCDETKCSCDKDHPYICCVNAVYNDNSVGAGCGCCKQKCEVTTNNECVVACEEYYYDVCPPPPPGGVTCLKDSNSGGNDAAVKIKPISDATCQFSST